MNRGHAALALACALTLGLVASSRLDPTSPLLPASRGTWWGSPDPPSGHGIHGPFQRTFLFSPAVSGQLRVTALGTWELLDGADLLAASPALDEWRSATGVDVGRAPLTLHVEHPRWEPVVAFAGPAAPAAVTVAGGGDARPAAPVADRFRVRTSLPGAARHLPTLALAVLAVLALALVRRRPAAAAAARRRPVVVAAILLVHIALAAWNVLRYPWPAGLDAEAHLQAIEMVASSRRLPAAGDGFQTYHPPAYPIVGAAVWSVAGERGLQALSALCGLGLVALVAHRLGAARWRGLLLVAFAPVLVISEPQISNELPFALAATGLLTVASAERIGRARLGACGALAALALSIKYTGVPFAVAAGLALLLAPPPAGRARAGRVAAFAALVLVLAAPPYVDRLSRYGDPFIGNWDDALGHPYRQPPGVRTPSYFLGFGAGLAAHPFRARDATLWDSLYVSSVADGFGRLVRTDLQHALMPLGAWLALPLAAVTVAGLLSIAASGTAARRADWLALAAVLLGVAGLVRFNLELPYWSTAKGVFLLALALPVATAFERGRAALARRGPPRAALALDGILVAFAAVSVLAYAYR